MTRTMTVDGRDLTVGVDDEPRILDEDLGRRLGFREPRAIRKLIRRLFAEGEVWDTVSQTSRAGGRPGRAFLLTEAQALKVTAKSDTKIADAILDDVIRVFIAARRGLLPAPTPVLSHAPRVGDNTLFRDDMAAWCTMYVRARPRRERAPRARCGPPTVPGRWGLPRAAHSVAARPRVPPGARDATAPPADLGAREPPHAPRGQGHRPAAAPPLTKGRP